MAAIYPAPNTRDHCVTHVTVMPSGVSAKSGGSHGGALQLMADKPTQQIQPKKGEQAEISEPTRRGFLGKLRKVAKTPKRKPTDLSDGGRNIIEFSP